MTIKVTNCKDCIFRESNYNPDSMGYDTVVKIMQKLQDI